ncbi:uncharacterized protein LOC125244747 isoform X2 [Megalobrama amblycephala]|uniref:uncharacterized protein LOC125244747 isoform X2 n=1 Tax=Megalobrama amblycephala TaxID=75352 RepID=UPI0020147BD0|nr:uncharacterized protein LOC125244747 isoform X2 [Megalobrama amblycephala]
MMDDLYDFLKSRNINDDIIQKMQQDKIDCSVIPLMTDDQLKEYLPSYGDRLAICGYCVRKEQDPSGRKSKFFERLRTRLARSKGDTVNVCNRRSKNALKSMRKIEIGWMHFREGKFTQVRSKRGGGTRKVTVSKDWRKKDILEKATKLFFPDVKCFSRSFTDFVVDVSDFQGQTIDDQITVGELYELTKLSMLRLYFTTKEKVITSDTQFNFKSETIEQGGENVQDSWSPTHPENIESHLNYVGSHSLITTGSDVLLSDSITTMIDASSAIKMEAANQLKVDNLEDNGTVTISTGLISGLEDTLPLLEEPYSVPPIDNSLEPFVQSEKGKKILVVHRGQVLQQLIAHFCDESVLKDGISMKVILPDGRLENAVDEGGVLRDLLSEFWHDFFEQCTLGNSFKVPYLRHDFGQQQWQSIGRIIAFGWQKEKYLPVKIAPVMLEQAAHGCLTTSLVDCFLRYVSESDRMILESCRSDFENVDKEELFEVLDHHNCRRVPTADNIEQLLEEMAHQKLIQEPAFVIEQWHYVLAPMRIELQNIAAAYEELQPTSRKVMKSIAYPATMNVQQKHIAGYLSTFLREADEQHLSLFLRFCTGSDLFLGKNITVGFTQLEGFQRRPTAHTCGCYLELPVNYDNYPEFCHEMNTVLESNIWVMDIV